MSLCNAIGRARRSKMRLPAVTLGVLLIATACGGGEGVGSDDRLTDAVAVPEREADDEAEGEDPAEGGDLNSEIDPTDLPETGEKRLELDGQTYIFTGGDCTVTETSFGLAGSVGQEEERVSLTAMGNLVGDAWAIAITAEAAGSGVIIHSQGESVEAPVVDGSAMAVDAVFVRSESGNFDDVEELGRGRLVANCP